MPTYSSWASRHIERLLLGETVSFRPRGNSMVPRIKSGQLCTVEPLSEPPAVDDVVLCRVRGSCYLHLVRATEPAKDMYLIGNNRGHLNGWIGRQHVYGKLTKVED